METNETGKMIYNPLFLKQFNSGDSSQLAQNKFANASYLFADIVQVLMSSDVKEISGSVKANTPTIFPLQDIIKNNQPVEKKDELNGSLSAIFSSINEVFKIIDAKSSPKTGQSSSKTVNSEQILAIINSFLGKINSNEEQVCLIIPHSDSFLGNSFYLEGDRNDFFDVLNQSKGVLTHFDDVYNLLELNKHFFLQISNDNGSVFLNFEPCTNISDENLYNVSLFTNNNGNIFKNFDSVDNIFASVDSNLDINYKFSDLNTSISNNFDYKTANNQNILAENSSVNQINDINVVKNSEELSKILFNQSSDKNNLSIIKNTFQLKEVNQQAKNIFLQEFGKNAQNSEKSINISEQLFNNDSKQSKNIFNQGITISNDGEIKSFLNQNVDNDIKNFSSQTLNKESVIKNIIADASKEMNVKNYLGNEIKSENRSSVNNKVDNNFSNIIKESKIKDEVKVINLIKNNSSDDNVKIVEDFSSINKAFVKTEEIKNLLNVNKSNIVAEKLQINYNQIKDDDVKNKVVYNDTTIKENIVKETIRKENIKPDSSDSIKEKIVTNKIENKEVQIKDNSDKPAEKIEKNFFTLRENENNKEEIEKTLNKNINLDEKQKSSEDILRTTKISKEEEPVTKTEKAKVEVVREEIQTKEEIKISLQEDGKINSSNEKKNKKDDNQIHLTEKENIIVKEHTGEKEKDLIVKINKKVNQLSEEVKNISPKAEETNKTNQNPSTLIDKEEKTAETKSSTADSSFNNEANTNEHSDIEKENTNHSNVKVENSFKNVINHINTEEIKAEAKETIRTLKIIEIVKEIEKYIEKKESGTITFNVKPEHLGKVKIEIEVIDNVAKAIVQVENTEAKKLIENNLNQLTNNLLNAGMQLNSFKVTTGNNEQRTGKNNYSTKTRTSKKESMVEEVSDEYKKQMGYNTYEYLM